MKGGVLNLNCLMVRKQAFHFPFELLRNLELRARVNDVSSFLFAKLQNSSILYIAVLNILVYMNIICISRFKNSCN